MEINLPDRQIVGGAPIGVHLPEQFGRQRFVRYIFLVRLHRRAPCPSFICQVLFYILVQFQEIPSPSHTRARTLGAVAPMPAAC